MKSVVMILLLSILCMSTVSYAGNGDLTVSGSLGVGTPTPATSAAVDITSTTKGFLPPRMSTTERNSIAPAAGLFIYNTTEKAYNYFNGTSWGAIKANDVIYDTTLIADQASVTIENLDGNADICWELIAAIETSVANTAVLFRYNGDNTNTNYKNNYNFATTSTDDQPTLLIGSSTIFGLGRQLINAKTGSSRVNSGQSNTPGVTSGFRVNNGWWKNSTDNITSITIFPSTGNLKTGSRIILRRML